MNLSCRPVLIAFMALTLVFTLVTNLPALVYQQWDYRTAGPNHSVAEAISAGVDSSGNVYTAGEIWRNNFSSDFYITKFNPEGQMGWISYYNSQGSNFDIPVDLTVDPQGNVYVFGTQDAYGDNPSFVTVKYNSLGEMQWASVFDYTGDLDFAEALAVDAQGNVYCTGSTRRTGGYYDLAIVKYDSQGTQQWVAVYSDGHINTQPIDIAVDDQESVFVTGISEVSGNNHNYCTLKYDSQGLQQWVAIYDGTFNSYNSPCALRLDTQGNVYVSGTTHPSANNTDFTTVKYNSAGVQQWVASYDSPSHTYEQAADLEIDSQGQPIVAGYSYSGGWATVKYDANGVQQWVRNYGTVNYFSQSTNKMGLGVDLEDNVYVTAVDGALWDNLYSVTLKYNPQGGLQWIANYNDDGCVEEGRDVMVDQAGNVLVRGGFWWPDYGELHLMLIKFNQPDGDFTAAMNPTISPVVIPASGGAFNYNLQSFNTVRSNLAADYWWKVIFPPPSTHTAQIGPEAHLLPLDSTSWLRSQNVPGSAPAGIYQYILYAGDYPNLIWATDTILVTKLTTGEGPSVAGDWSCTGEEFPSLLRVDRGGLVLVSPNPFNPTTDVRYKIQDARNISLKVYDIAGRLVSTLADGWQEAGPHSATFDGSKLAAGVYLVRLKAGGEVQVGKMVLLK